jgi:hypothetical protein
MYIKGCMSVKLYYVLDHKYSLSIYYLVWFLHDISLNEMVEKVVFMSD